MGMQEGVRWPGQERQAPQASGRRLVLPALPHLRHPELHPRCSPLGVYLLSYSATHSMYCRLLRHLCDGLISHLCLQQCPLLHHEPWGSRKCL